MSLTAFLRPTLSLYSPRQRSANDAFPTPRTNTPARQAMQPARINTSSKSGLPRDPEQWTDEDLATCAGKHFKLGRTAPLLALIDEFRLTPAALWYLHTDDEELSRLTNGNSELQEQVVDLAVHIRPAVSPTTPRRMNAMQLSVVLDIPAPAPPPPPPPVESEAAEDDDDAAQSVVSDWALDEQPYEEQEEATDDAQIRDTYAAEQAPFPLGGALGLDTTGGQQVETPAEAAPEHAEEPQQAEDLIQFGEDEPADDQGASVPISQVEPDNVAEAEATETSGPTALAEDLLFSDEEDELSEYQRVVVVHDVPSYQEDVESVEPSQTGGTPSEDDAAADDDSTATAQPETQAVEPVSGVAAAIEEPAPSEGQPPASAEEHSAEDSAVVPGSTEHGDTVASREESPEPEALHGESAGEEPAPGEVVEVAAQPEVMEEQRQEQEGQRSDIPSVSGDARTEAEGDLTLGILSETPAESAHTDNSHFGGSMDAEDATVRDLQDAAGEHEESQEQATTRVTETREQSVPTHDTPEETVSTQDTSSDSQSPAEEPQPHVSYDTGPSAESKDTQLPETHTEDDTDGAQHPFGATSVDDSSPAPAVVPDGADGMSQNTNTSEPEHLDEKEEDHTTAAHTTVAPIAASTSSPGAHTPSESSPSSPIQKQTDSDTAETRRALDTQRSSSGRNTVPPIVTSEGSAAAGVTDLFGTSEQLQFPGEHEAPPASTEGGDGSVAAVSSPEAQSAVEVNVADAMSSSLLPEDDQVSTEHADPALSCPQSGDAVAEANTGVLDNIEGDKVVVPPLAREMPPSDREPDTSQGNKNGGDVEGDLEPGWHTVSKKDAPQVNNSEGKVPAAGSPARGSPGEEQEDGDEDEDGAENADEDENAEGGSEGEKDNGGGGGGGVGGSGGNKPKKPRKKGSGSGGKRKKGKKGR